MTAEEKLMVESYATAVAKSLLSHAQANIYLNIEEEPVFRVMNIPVDRFAEDYTNRTSRRDAKLLEELITEKLTDSDSFKKFRSLAMSKKYDL